MRNSFSQEQRGCDRMPDPLASSTVQSRSGSAAFQNVITNRPYKICVDESPLKDYCFVPGKKYSKTFFFFLFLEASVY